MREMKSNYHVCSVESLPLLVHALFNGNYIYCDGCGNLKGQCICSLLPVCDICGLLVCVCTHYVCKDCGMVVCICNYSGGVPSGGGSSGGNNGNTILKNVKLKFDVSKYPGYKKGVRDCKGVSNELMKVFLGKGENIEKERMQLYKEEGGDYN